MGFMDALNGYYDISLRGTKLFPIIAETMTFIVLIGGLFLLTVLMIPFFILGLLMKVAGVKDEED